RRRLAGAPPLLALPADRPRPPVERHRGERIAFAVEPATGAAVEGLARRLGATPFMVLLAAFQALLGRLAGAREVVVGTPVANRRRVEVEGLIGFFANTLAMRTDTGGDPTFAALVARVREGTLADFEHQDLPFEELVAALAPPRDLSHAPVFQALFALQSAPRPAPAADGGLAIARAEAHGGTAKFDLSLTLSPAADGGLAASLEIDRDLFDRATGERWARGFSALLAAAVAAPERPVALLPIAAAADRRQVVVDFEPPPVAYPGPPLLHQLVARQAAATPEAPAVRFEGEELSYRELARRAGALAAELVALGVGPETRVAVAMERSLELMVALVAVLAADGAYVPLDSGYPEERLRHMAGDALGGQAAPVLLTQPALAGRFAALAPAGTRAIALPPGGAVAEAAGEEQGASAFPPPRALPDSPAYVIYTSGSTGRPKGAVNTHRAIRNRLLWMQDAFSIGPGDRVLQKTPTSFDVSVWELFWPLLTGACVVMARPGGHGDAAYLARTIAEERVTVLHFVPSMLQVFLAEPGVERLADLRRVVASGEALPPALVRRFRERLPHVALDNLYGPTEAAVDVSWWPCREAAPRVVPIGRPIANLRLHVVDRRMEPVPVGVPGELLLGGVGLARGYHRRPGLTAERWVPDPFAGEVGGAGGVAPGGRLYRTGDLVRWRADGSVEYLGRIDHQVKLRGLRIELGEIEAALAAHPAVREAAAMVRGERLVAFVVAGGAPDDAALRAWLRARLPEPMVPSAFVRLDAMPLSPNGKADRRALAEVPVVEASAAAAASAERIDEGVAGPQAGGAAPPVVAGLVERVAAIWAGVLERDRVPARVSFFDLGGHSLLLVEVQRRLRRDLGVELSVVDLFRHPTVSALAEHLRAVLADAPPRPSALARAELPAADRRLTAPDLRIAVVGLAGRFPDAPDVDALWELLAAGREAVRNWSDDELAAAGVDAATLADPAYVRAGVLLPGADLFDAGLWGISPREAEAIDPQQRVFLETALEALEDAGVDPDRFAGAIGVFAGSGENRNPARLARRPDVVRALGPYQVLIANRADSLPTRVAYKLGLRGPAVTVQTACSTSLVAVHLACRALLGGDCDAALAGGVSVGEREPRGYLHDPGGIASPDGRTRPFDADARGTVRGHGAGVVVLRRLADALADGDPVRAVLLGTAINNDGAGKTGFTAPGFEGQAAALAAAHRAAGIAPATLGYVEAHGTGTALGDPVEVAALREAMRRGGGEPERCGIGSLKSNLGHLDAAAGVAGLIKTILALERELLPPTLHFRRPNPAIDFGPLAVVAEPTPWPRGERPRRAAVSSFGIGGTNAHAVVEEAPPPPPAPPRELPGWEVLTLTAATPAALEAATDRLADWLEARPGLSAEELADV
ncbi:MAG TPA: amino acid adenylation domain-containing protein, partial [Thermoanaerobaculia bacterium]|nr:amino acid adenylation domain-containing protein [Thermoanaerobaculia bacterium]